jgi:hypothetical protein
LPFYRSQKNVSLTIKWLLNQNYLSNQVTKKLNNRISTGVENRLSVLCAFVFILTMLITIALSVIIDVPAEISFHSLVEYIGNL